MLITSMLPVAIVQESRVPVSKVVTLVTAEGDARLSVKYPMSARGIELGELLQDLQQKSGVKLKAKEESIARLQVAVFTRPLPLHQLLQRISTLLNLTWAVREIKGVRQYTLYESEANRRYREGLVEAGWRGAMERIQKGSLYARISPQDRGKLAESGDTIAADILRDPQLLHGIPVLSWLDESVVKKLSKNETLFLSYQQLPESVQKALQALVQNKIAENVQKYEQAKKRYPMVKIEPPNPSPDLFKTSICYSVDGEAASTRITALCRGEFGLFSLRFPANTPDPSSLWFPSLYDKTQQKLMPQYRASRRKIEVDFQSQERSFIKYLEQVHTTLNINVFADAYFKPKELDRYDGETIAISLDTGSRLQQAIQMGGLWGKVCWQEGETGEDILFRGKSWYLLGDGAKADNLLTVLTKKLKERKPLSLEDIAEAVMLPVERKNILSRVLGVDFGLMDSYAGLFKFYQVLSPKEKYTLTQEGISGGSLGGDSLRAFHSFLQFWRVSGVDEGGQNLRLRLRVEDASSVFLAEVSLPNGKVEVSTLGNFDAVPDWGREKGSK